MTFDEDEDMMIVYLKKDTGIKQTTELMRYIIKLESKKIPNADNV